MSEAPLRLEMVQIEKRFGGVQALKGANLAARHGEILGLCGENGAGKSTMLKVLSGVYPHGTYRGEVILDGKPLALTGPAEARRAGIAIVHQELMLVPGMTVAENLLLGREPRRFGLVDDARIEVEARRLLERFGFGEIDVAVEVRKLGIGLQQVVEIVRALSFDAGLLVLDEPTAALTEKESGRLMALARELRARGTTIVYVSHRMDEVFALCDRITVMRDGRTVETVVTREVEPREVIAKMVGREVASGRPSPRPTPDAHRAAAIEVVDLSLRAAGTGRVAVDRFSVAVAEGEVVALCGAMGAGRTAVLSTLFGCADGAVSGQVRVGGVAVELDSPGRAIDAGLALLPEDRKGKGLVLGMTVAENLALPERALAVDELGELLRAKRRIDELHIRGDAGDAVAKLSGGNQQKVVLGKWLERAPKVLLLDEPTRGVDVGAREEIYGIIDDLCRNGTAVLMASSDLPEVLRLAHRILVLRDGRVAGALDGATATQEAIVHLSTGAAALDKATS